MAIEVRRINDDVVTFFEDQDIEGNIATSKQISFEEGEYYLTASPYNTFRWFTTVSGA